MDSISKIQKQNFKHIHISFELFITLNDYYDRLSRLMTIFIKQNHLKKKNSISVTMMSTQITKFNIIYDHVTVIYSWTINVDLTYYPIVIKWWDTLQPPFITSRFSIITYVTSSYLQFSLFKVASYTWKWDSVQLTLVNLYWFTYMDPHRRKPLDKLWHFSCQIVTLNPCFYFSIKTIFPGRRSMIITVSIWS